MFLSGVQFQAFCCLVLAICLPSVASSQSAAVQMSSLHRTVLQDNCFDCHDSATRDGNVDLESLSLAMDTVENAERWNSVLRVINAGEMPPEDADPIPESVKADFLSALSQNIVKARSRLSDVSGRITLRRLNRREYANTIEDMLGVRVNVSGLPDDVIQGGFDTSGGGLFLSSDQLEAYLSVGRAAIDQHLNPAWRSRRSKTIRVEAEVVARQYVQEKLDKIQEQLRNAKLANANPSKLRDYGFRDKDKLKLVQMNASRSLPAYQAYLAHPKSRSGAIIGIFDRELTTVPVAFGKNLPFGNYEIRVRAAALRHEGLPEHLHGLELVSVKPRTKLQDASVLSCQQIASDAQSPQEIVFKIRIDAESGRQFALRARQHQVSGRYVSEYLKTLFADEGGESSRTKTSNKSDNRKRRNLAGRAKKNSKSKGSSLQEFDRSVTSNLDTIAMPFIWVDWVQIQGPVSNPVTEKYQQLHACLNGQAPSLGNTRKFLSHFARIAFRSNDVSPQFLGRLVDIVKKKTKASNFNDALRTAMSIVLASPRFLYLTEPASDNMSRNLTDIELANRIAYFLWSGPPDAELLTLAHSGNLSQPSILKAQVNRLLADEKATRFVQSFTHQWLDMERLDFFQFDLKHFSSFDESLRASARQEVVEMVMSCIRDGRSVRELLNSDHVLINDVLALHYGIDGVEGPEFREVPVPAGNPRGGLLATAAVLAMGSDGVHSSPVERGVWVLRHLLHDPPPPAPANVPQLSRDEDPHQSIRALQISHQQDAQCAQCHRNIDPIGYGMHNFAADGGWREKEVTAEFSDVEGKRFKPASSREHPIDPSGTLPDGTAFANFNELRTAVASHDLEFSRGLTEALIEYGLGRPYGFTDQELADAILRDAQDNQLRMSALIHSLIQSDAFRTKK